LSRFLKISLRLPLLLVSAGLVLAGLLLTGPVALRAQEAPAASTVSSTPGGADSANTAAAGQEDDVYRHSSTVQSIARWLHLDPEPVARGFEDLNFAILAAAILYGLFKYLPQTLRKRREDIQQRLVDARAATEQAKQRLRAVEEKFARLDEEIAALRAQAEREGVAEEARMKALIEAERQRIVASAEQEIAAAALAARRELKRFAAELAVRRARQMVSVDDDRDRALVRQFTQELGEEARNGGRN
jgi:F-type H+-transporting ATPase subunit b